MSNSVETSLLKDDEELMLERLVFGDQSGFESNLREVENLYEYSEGEDDLNPHEFSQEEDEEPHEEDTGVDTFFIDEAADVLPDFEQEDRVLYSGNGDESDGEVAWVDSDDEKINVSVISTRLKKLRQSQEEHSLSGSDYQARLRSQYEKLYPRPSWSDDYFRDQSDQDHEINSPQNEEDAKVGLNTAGLSQILNSTNKFIQTTTKLIPSHHIDILRLKDANILRRSKSGIQSLNFHPLHPLLITGGVDQTLRIYHIDGKTNQFVSLVYFRDVSIRKCQFLTYKNGNFVYLAGRRRYMYRWDLANGEVEKILRMYGQEKFQKSYEYFKVSPFGSFIALKGSSGWVNLVSGQTGQFAKGFKVNGFVTDFAFTHDEKSIIISNESGEIWEFVVNSSSNKPSRRWTDISAVNVTKIALGGPGDRWLALGTRSGIVNIFDRSTFDSMGAGENPKPYKEVSNLVTAITNLTFTPDGQILCISSSQKKDALKLVHLPLGTAFSNWPTSGTPLGRVTVAEFTPNGQMLAIGNDVGKITLWRIGHY